MPPSNLVFLLDVSGSMGSPVTGHRGHGATTKMRCVDVAALFAAAPFVVANAPPEQTMGLVQKIFYYHVPSAMMMFVSAFVCGSQ